MATFVRASVGEGAKTLDARWYVSPDVFAQEQERIFARQWIGIGRVEHVENPGDFFLANVAGESLIVTRDTTGTLHAFYNVCRHRGTKLCVDEAGQFKGSIQCPYHAWTYGLDGALKVARNMDEVPGFALEDYSLREVALEIWEGFILVNLARDPEPFSLAFAPLLTRFGKWQLPKLRVSHTIRYDVATNWKLIFQNYSECYHCPLVHPQLEKLSPSDSGRNDLTEGAFLGGYSELRGYGKALTRTGVTLRSPVGDICGEDMNRVYYYTVFPSMLLSLHCDYVMVHFIYPIAPGRTIVDCCWLFDDKAMTETQHDPSDAVEFWDVTNRQDWHVNELTFAGLQSRSYTPGPYANAEGLLVAFDRHYLQQMNGSD
jgi:Rieske 2Fe-2S family protein